VIVFRLQSVSIIQSLGLHLKPSPGYLKGDIGRPKRRWNGNSKMNLKYGYEVWTGFRIGSNGGFLLTR
jgi:hypothetical protein